MFTESNCTSAGLKLDVLFVVLTAGVASSFLYVSQSPLMAKSNKWSPIIPANDPKASQKRMNHLNKVLNKVKVAICVFTSQEEINTKC